MSEFVGRSRNWTLALIGGAAGIILLLLLGLVQYKAALNDEEARNQAQQSSERQALVEAYVSLLRDVETGQRGFIVTGNDEFLQPMLKGMEQRKILESGLRDAYASDAASRRKLDELFFVGDRRIDHASETVRIYREVGQDAAERRIRTGEGKAIMDEGRAIAAEMETAETRRARLVLANAADTRLANQRSIAFLELLALIAIVIMSLGLFRTVRELRSTSSQLRDMSRRREAIFEGGDDAKLILDQKGNIEAMNRAAERLFDIARADAIGQSNLMLFADPPSKKESRAYLAALSRGEKWAAPSQMFTGIRGDGAKTELEVVTTPIDLEDGQYYLAIARDATERRKIERMKNEFVATVSHELRTPLTSIAGSLGLLAGGTAGELPDKAKRLIDIAHGNSERLIRLINDMLDIEKIESGQMQLNMRSLALCPTMRTAMADAEGFAAKHKVTVTGERCDPDWTVIADEDRLIQIMTNLLSNAIKFSPENGMVKVHVAEKDGGAHYRITVRDEGPGIPEKFRKTIFSKFAQADSTTTRQKGGTGLGLSIVRELVQRMGGKVGFDSEEGKGTTFWVDLPVPTRQARLGDQPAVEGDSRLPLILIVEDDDDMTRVVESAFEKFSRVRSVGTINQARLALQRQKFDLVILDVVMPDGRGTEIIPLLGEGDARIPTILFTAFDKTADEPDVDVRLIKSKSSMDDLCQHARSLVASKGAST